jgi:hypothetical protein
MAKRARHHPRRSRFRIAADSQEQLEDLEFAQKVARKGKIKKLIQSTEESKQRLDYSLRKINNAEIAYDEYYP